ncbi:hypothetical protein EEB14_50805 [Rhodococcus sp. WS4]|nr:hypothetical protein EEB14_50805 [Rhodococcus sp. WS4]
MQNRRNRNSRDIVCRSRCNTRSTPCGHRILDGFSRPVGAFSRGLLSNFVQKFSQIFETSLRFERPTLCASELFVSVPLMCTISSGGRLRQRKFD